MFRRYLSSTVGFVGVDLERDACRLLQVRPSGGRLDVVGAAVIKSQGRDLDTGDLAEQIKAAIASGRFTGRRCAVSLPRHLVHLQSVRLPPMPDDEMREAAVWEAAQRFELDRSTMEADFIRTGANVQGSEKREEVLLVAAQHDAMHRYLAPLLEAGLRPVAVEPWFTAIARLLSRRHRRESDRGVVRAVIEVGPASSVVMILRGDQIALCRTVPIGGAKFDAALSEHLEMDLDAASELRRARIAAGGSATSDIDPSTDRAVYEAVRPLMSELVKEVTLCLRYYGVTFRGHPPDSIVLTGLDGLEPHLDRVISQSCKTPVQLDDDIHTLASMGESIRTRLNRDLGPTAAWAAAAGLSLRGVPVRALEDRETRRMSA